MTPAEIESIERELGIRLPGDYRTMALAYPFPEDSALADYAMVDRSADLLARNRAMRAHPWSPAWKREYFVIGHDGGECWFFIDTSRPQSPVFEVSIEDRGVIEHSPGLADFVARYQKIDADAAAEPARTSASWWRRRLWKR